MKKTITNIFFILTGKEKNEVIQLIFLDILVSILDIGFLAMLLLVMQFYTNPASTISTYLSFNIFKKSPLLLIALFFILFSIKNYFAFRIIRMQLKFIYQVASRLSEKNLAGYLNGDYNNYVNIDSSVHIRRIGQQPIEFGHYVLGGFQQIVSQSVLILITIIAILIYNPVLFALLFIILAPPIILIGFLMKKKSTQFVKQQRTSVKKRFNT